MRRVAIIGKFDTAAGVSDGQAVKTNILTEEIERAFGKAEVLRINTYGWKKNPARLFLRSIHSVWNSKNVIFMTDEGGIKIYPWLLQMANIMHRCRLHYVVVGGWLDHRLAKSEMLCKLLKRLDGIYVETNTMKKALDERGFTNVLIMPNCKRLHCLEPDELVYTDQEPYRLCIFSRIMKEKGIEDAVNAVQNVNEQFGRTVFCLDIYGQVDEGQIKWFQALKESFPPYICYGGVIDYRKSVELLKSYFALLFPTRFYTEGIPGTIIDAYASGVPVIASEWESCADIMDEKTGIIYEFASQSELEKALLSVAEAPDSFQAKKQECLRRAKAYTPEAVMEILLSRLHG